MAQCAANGRLHVGPTLDAVNSGSGSGGAGVLGLHGSSVNSAAEGHDQSEALVQSEGEGEGQSQFQSEGQREGEGHKEARQPMDSGDARSSAPGVSVGLYRDR